MFVLYTSLTIKGYISEIRQYEHRKILLSSSRQDILSYFGNYRNASAYDVFSHMRELASIYENEESGISYHTVNKKIRKLERENLIKRSGLDPEIENDSNSDEGKKQNHRHNRIPYKLTTGGIYHLFLNCCLIDFVGILENYPENIIFRTMLYPYFQRSTISNIFGLEILDWHWGEDLFAINLGEYLSKCCRVTEEILDGILTYGYNPRK
jgi:hypothetical protein